MNTTTSTRRRSWRVVDIVIVSVIAAACSLIFFVWNNAVYPASSAATAGFPPLGGLIGGAWLIAGPLGGLIIRKPGAALYCELVAAIISALLGSSFGLTVIWSGLYQGVGAELVFLLFAYRRFDLPVALLSGLASGVVMAVMENIIYNPEWTMDYKLVYVLCGAVSGLVLAGLGAWALTRGLVATGVLDSVAAGRDARRAASRRRPA
ncbi:ECF transporter S component [Rothia kristinae]|uniref:ECF transporter S component n=1 Tax=Rothia kristinae TaxID=37923 RepID=A0A7T4MSV9_9MICC|nr:ECF transporter S component [Rothia kristinae]MDN5639713.1 ECF transporter S component [Actinomycetes bacterium]QQC58934.1 ECF transporter S component [Rothia kristinae]